MKFYYTAREAQQRLGISVGAFYYLIETGKIKKLTPLGRKQGFYSKYLIERLASTGPMAVEEETGISFTQATLDDISEEYELAVLLLNGSAGYGLPTYETWLRKNAATNFLVRDHDRLVAFMHVLPVAQHRIEQWLRGEIREWEITAADVQAYATPGPLECIIPCMVTTADVAEGKRRRYGMHLIRGFLQFLPGLASQGITITRFYSASAMPEVIAMLEQAGFEERGQPGKRVALELNPLTATTHMARHYRAMLRHHNVYDDMRGEPAGGAF